MSSFPKFLLLTLSFAFVLGACGGEGGGELEVTNIDPRAGATSGSQVVQIKGNHFRSDISYTVYFGNRRVERSTLLDEHTLVVATPQVEDPGPVDVIIAADNGPAYRIQQGFTFEDMGGNVMERVGGPAGAQGGGEERF